MTEQMTKSEPQKDKRHLNEDWWEGQEASTQEEQVQATKEWQEQEK